MTKIIKAVLAVMEEVKSIEKNLEVGTGRSSYKGVADKDVKLQVGQAMQKNGLIIITKDIQPESTLSEWDQEETYSGQTQTKHKTMVFTKIKTIYTLYHESGESLDLVGYGHGVDSQDKSAGKATTYALKYALLNTFLIPTGDIDDTDSQHSDSLPQKPVSNTTYKAPEAPKTARKVEGVCDYHNCDMYLNKNGKLFHRDGNRPDGDKFCNGMGFPSDAKAWKETRKPLAPKSNLVEEIDEAIGMSQAEVESINSSVPF